MFQRVADYPGDDFADQFHPPKGNFSLKIENFSFTQFSSTFHNVVTATTSVEGGLGKFREICNAELLNVRNI